MDALQLANRVHRALRGKAGPEDTTAQRILDAAGQQLELFGIQRTTMEDVARRAGVSRVTIYRRFATKEALVDAVVLEEVRRFLGSLGRRLDDIADEREKLVEGLVFTVTTLRRHTLLQQLLRGEPELFLPQLTTEAAPLIAFAREMIVDYTRPRLPDVELEDIEVGAEVGVRLMLSLILTPVGVIDMDDTDQLRRLATRYARPFLQPERRPRKRGARP